MLNVYLIYEKHFRGPLAFGGPRQCLMGKSAPSHTFYFAYGPEADLLYYWAAPNMLNMVELVPPSK